MTQDRHFMLLFAALYLSEGWYETWVQNSKRLHAKARAIVLYDRALNEDIETLIQKGGETA